MRSQGPAVDPGCGDVPFRRDRAEENGHGSKRSQPKPWTDTPLTGRLVLADGTVIAGQGLGATGSAVGEVCFNTAMTGYQEILTDPSYAGQIITFTFPHIGNVGTNHEDTETSNLADALGRARLRAARRRHRARPTTAPPSSSTSG